MNYKILSKKKKQLDRKRPLPKALLQNLEEWFRVELTYTSNAIEGNTLSRAETALVVEKGLTVGGKTLNEHLEATNHAFALDWIKKIISKRSFSLNEEIVLQIHALILKGIDDINAGRYRNVPVRISGSSVVLPNPIKVPHLMNRFIEQLKSSKKIHPVERALIAHYELVTIHPFIDGNGRTARLLMNLLLMQKGYPPAIIRKRDRLKYLTVLEQAQLGGAKEDYYQFMIKAVDRSLNIYLEAIEGNNETTSLAEPTLLRIGALAKQTQQTVSTIRHWTKEGLLEVTELTPAGYQLYAEENIAQVEKILALKSQRLTLGEIKEKII